LRYLSETDFKIGNPEMFDLQASQQEHNTNAVRIHNRRSDQTTSKHTLKQNFSWHSPHSLRCLVYFSQKHTSLFFFWRSRGPRLNSNLRFRGLVVWHEQRVPTLQRTLKWFRPWGWKQFLYPKHHHPPTRLYDGATQRITIFTSK
jgi:hypothetical protein